MPQNVSRPSIASVPIYIGIMIHGILVGVSKFVNKSSFSQYSLIAQILLYISMFVFLDLCTWLVEHV